MDKIFKKCNHGIARLRKMSENLRTILTDERKTGTNFMFLSLFENVHVFTAFFTYVSGQNFQYKNMAARKNLHLNSLPGAAPQTP